MIEQKKVSNIRTVFSSLAFVLLSILGGFFIGFAAGAIGTFVYLVIVFPIIIGFSGGKMITDNAKFTKTRNASLIIITSVLMALVIFGAIFYARFLGFQVTTSLIAFKGLSDENLRAANVFVDYALEKETGHPGFVGYVLYKADQGVSIGRVFRSNALNLGPIVTWLYWLVELGIIGFITVFMSRDISKKPFCETCNSWYPGKKHIGGIPAVKELEIMNLIKLNDYSGVGQALEENADVPSTEFYLQSCPTCEKSFSSLSVTKVRSVNGKLTFTDLLNTTLTPGQSKMLG